MQYSTDTLLNFIKKYEGFKLKAYQDSVGIWTIGYGTIMYPDGNKVEQGDVITPQQATDYLMYEVEKKSKAVEQYIKTILTQNQFDALVSFAYNVGVSAFKNSTLLKIINKNPNDLEKIKAEFLKWTKAGGKVINGLYNRRLAEYNLYSTK